MSIICPSLSTKVQSILNFLLGILLKTATIPSQSISQTVDMFPNQIRKSVPSEDTTVILVFKSCAILDSFLNPSVSPMTSVCHWSSVNCLGSTRLILSLKFLEPISFSSLLRSFSFRFLPPLAGFLQLLPLLPHPPPPTHTHQQTANPPMSKQYLEKLSFIKSGYYQIHWFSLYHVESELIYLVTGHLLNIWYIYNSFPACFPSLPNRWYGPHHNMDSIIIWATIK